MESTHKIAIIAAEVAPNTRRSTYPEPYFSRMSGRTKRAGDSVVYPDDDIQAALGADGAWQFRHKDGTPYPAQ